MRRFDLPSEVQTKLEDLFIEVRRVSPTPWDAAQLLAGVQKEIEFAAVPVAKTWEGVESWQSPFPPPRKKTQPREELRPTPLL